MRIGTQYHEGEREVTPTILSNFNLNPIAFQKVVEQYKKNCGPMPVRFILEAPPDAIMDGRADSKNMVELTLQTPGYVGTKWADKKGIDPFFLKFAAISYYQQMRPIPVDFLYLGVEVHLRTPGVSDSYQKNPMREIYNPTVDRAPKSLTKRLKDQGATGPSKPKD